MKNPDQGMTIDELARECDMTTRKLRLYQTKGLLQPPTLVGRTGYYTDEHLSRLTLIERLQKRGFSLAGIAELIERAGRGEGLDDLLGIEQVIAKPWSREQPYKLTRAEMQERLGEAFDAALVKRSTELGLLRVEGDGYEILMPTMFEFGADMVKRGMPTDAALDELERLKDDAAGMVKRFATLFRTHVLPTMVATDPQGALTDLVKLSADLPTRLRALVVANLMHAVDEHFANFDAANLPAVGSLFEPDDDTNGP